ncbi:MAG: GNAT family N-acetyltransferase [Chloroflexi bacterium]|nr:GNAT family N-acetyltransferase [Chloroflexota bacterium]
MDANAAEVLIADGDLTLRRMRDEADDYALIAKWLTDDRVLEYVYGRDNAYPFERTVEKFRPRVLGDDADMVVPCIMLLGGVPVGYLQFYPVSEELQPEYGLSGLTGLYAMDLFIGEPAEWNRGAGTRMVKAAVRYLFGVLGAEQVAIDPRVTNPRAVRTYEKCGFVKVKVLPGAELHEGNYEDCWLMMCSSPPAAE